MSSCPYEPAESLKTLLGDQHHVVSKDPIQSLWSGYGELFRVHTDNPALPSLIVKAINLPKVAPKHHPKGWNTELSNQRKLKSYQVEFHWYQHYVVQMPIGWAPRCLAAENHGSHYELLLEDLKLVECARVVKTPTNIEIETALRWLAQFHAFWLGTEPTGLWQQGTYWHLATRPDEWRAMTPSRYKAAAERIDDILNDCRYQTLVHGDAKLANFCFNEAGTQVSAVDFQYVGGGVGVKDIALFLCTVLDFDDPLLSIDTYVETYFGQLEVALATYQPNVDASDVCHEWRKLLGLAWADYQRFLLGWSPVHERVNAFTNQLTLDALDDFQL
ncbi:phosphotransferase [Vibrio sp. 10N]|uniref:phosphotransferase n=1 Tax=Vibrio sp. 10N TaxID=3058938 RepID=UPI002813A4C6|nr:DUF1679 domain-containing protein [Vibrio sp. 10N]